MRDILCPNCSKDDYDIIMVNGVKVKQCIHCQAIYQLAEKEIGPDYLPGSKDAAGNFISCPVCGHPYIKETAITKYYEDLGILFPMRGSPQLDKGKYICLNRKCFFIWDPPLF